MLYKKYHRNFVSQFKKGILYVNKGFSIKCNIIREPFISKYGIEFGLVDEESCCVLSGPALIINNDGMLISYIETTYAGTRYYRLNNTGERFYRLWRKLHAV